MSAPLEAPTGYVFFTEDYANPMFQDPALWQITDPESADAKRVMVIHTACGCPVALGFVETHENWHASLVA